MSDSEDEAEVTEESEGEQSEEVERGGRDSDGESERSEEVEEEDDEGGKKGDEDEESEEHTVEIGKYTFKREIKDDDSVQYVIVAGPTSINKCYRAKQGLVKFLTSKGLHNQDLSEFRFDPCKKRRRRTELGLGGQTARREEMLASRSDSHPLAKTARILHDVMDDQRAAPFLIPVASSLDAKTLASYESVISNPMDLGTIWTGLESGLYQTAHDVRRDMTLVWRNCYKFNGTAHNISVWAKQLSDMFERRYVEEVPVPSHNGMRTFDHGEHWVDHEAVLFRDGEWVEAVITAYDKASRKYTLTLEDSGEKEKVALPSHNVCITDDWSELADPIETWEGFSSNKVQVLNRRERTRRAPLPEPLPQKQQTLPAQKKKERPLKREREEEVEPGKPPPGSEE
eukprot:CAMPEP_0206221966 /NCGR_PEP_ID=MMETSP0047_2-20121206/5707_1 /ASSEMBLY_ACC=CAM_ASM_000192 /TAXON_ID=195065 /ORGANISM="Chroomonas mesostigmatica_cf, Strain CCMP1168" /LENGTH=398 /DNA_ID=CAMNT_0053644757 /DNA_START=91 /DNA_END=1288 /DNA_ORIENTATION=+